MKSDIVFSSCSLFLFEMVSVFSGSIYPAAIIKALKFSFAVSIFFVPFLKMSSNRGVTSAGAAVLFLAVAQERPVPCKSI